MDFAGAGAGADGERDVVQQAARGALEAGAIADQQAAPGGQAGADGDHLSPRLPCR